MHCCVSDALSQRNHVLPPATSQAMDEDDVYEDDAEESDLDDETLAALAAQQQGQGQEAVDDDGQTIDVNTEEEQPAKPKGRGGRKK